MQTLDKQEVVYILLDAKSSADSYSVWYKALENVL